MQGCRDYRVAPHVVEGEGMAHRPKKDRCRDCLLEQTGINAGIANDDLRRFVTRIAIGPGETFRVERAGNTVLVIGEGVIKSERRLADGRVAVTGFHYPGDVVEIPASVARETVFEAVTRCRVCEVDLKQAIRLVPDREALLACVGNHAMTRIADDETRILGLAHRSAAERVVAFLESLAVRPGARSGDPSVVWTPMRRDDIANFLGMQPETLSRTYAELARKGVIAVLNRGQVELLGDR